MPLSSPDGYLEFTNAVPRAVKMVATSNLGIGTSAPEYALDVHGTSNTGPLTVSSLTITDGAIGGDVSFSGNLAFTSDVTTSVDSNVVVEHKGPHGRDGAAVLKKYPEIVFDASKVDGNDTTNTLVLIRLYMSASMFTFFHINHGKYLMTIYLTTPVGYQTLLSPITITVGQVNLSYTSGNPSLTTNTNDVINGEWLQIKYVEKHN